MVARRLPEYLAIRKTLAVGTIMRAADVLHAPL
jgi:hypothetical protein